MKKTIIAITTCAILWGLSVGTFCDIARVQQGRECPRFNYGGRAYFRQVM